MTRSGIGNVNSVSAEKVKVGSFAMCSRGADLPLFEGPENKRRANFGEVVNCGLRARPVGGFPQL